MMRKTPALATMALLGASCVQGPSECGENVKRVLEIQFSGPSGIYVGEIAPFRVSMNIEKETDGEPAVACFAVRDEDPPWNPDDVLDVRSVSFDRDETSRTSGFNLQVVEVAAGSPIGGPVREVCGPQVDEVPEGCSGEASPTIYLDVVGSRGPDSSLRRIEIEDEF